MDNLTIGKVLEKLRKVLPQWKVPVVGLMAERPGDRAFYVLISTIISLRTKDAVTEQASVRLFDKAQTPQSIVQLSASEIEKLIYPAGFYRTKAKNILQVCRLLIDKYQGKVPDQLDQLLELPGVGRKTANLVVTVGYDNYGICVDTHVHRISNRWGYVKTKTPDETEMALRQKLPKHFWKTYNDILVTFGQNLCHPTSPWCSKCPVEKFCPKIGVKRSR
ncbi:MAG: endonuclease III [Deltaproteobacteria bacterium]|nr:endonuclease III [Deltaproteobacteria bacterium]